MDSKSLISIQQICIHYNVPVGFIKALQDYDLVKVTTTENEIYLQTNQLNNVEKMIRLHYDLDINLAGIDAIYNLLEKVESLQRKLQLLENKISFYEES